MGYVRALLHTLVLLDLCVPARVSACVYVRNYVKRRLQTLNSASAIANLPEISTATDLQKFAILFGWRRLGCRKYVMGRQGIDRSRDV